jgi:5'-3' exoribonuclease 1
MNSIVHNCIHGNDPARHEYISQLKDFEEVWASIMRAIDELVHTTKPTKLIMLALDGVAPRAKMNQQRARRFEKEKQSKARREELKKYGKFEKDLFDSN